MEKLGKCKDCGGVVSLRAATCPHCGRPNPVVRDSPPMKKEFNSCCRFIAVVGVIAGALLFLVSVAGALIKFSSGTGSPDGPEKSKSTQKWESGPAIYIKRVGAWRCYQGPKKFISLKLRGDSKPKTALMLTQNSPQPIIGFFHNEPKVQYFKSLVAYSSSHGQSVYELRCAPGHDLLEKNAVQFLGFMRAASDLVFLVDGKKYTARNSGFGRAEAWLQAPP